ncbi:MAG: hypothetical protein WBF17_18170 [Phycisphaerae bacterium]
MEKPQNAEGPPQGYPTIPDEAFAELIGGRSRTALRLAMYMASARYDPPLFARPLLGELLHQATELEEMLDACGARNNKLWRPFRSTIAAAKLFAGVNYELLHIRYSIPVYRLLDIDGDFAAATDEAMAFTGRVLLRIANRFLDQCRHLRVPLPTAKEYGAGLEERLPPGRLPDDRPVRENIDAGETVTYLATAFLSQAAESEMLHVPDRVDPSRYADCIPSSVSEQRLRQLQHRFHSLQSLYDTFVSDTDTERLNPDLPVLRGHVSVIFHLLVTATELAHYYERHVMDQAPQSPEEADVLVHGEELLDALMKYSLVYASRFLLRARDLCQDMLKRYAEVGRIEVPGPRYRGFHVRPSTLVAKAVRHYGSEVKMELDGETFDAASPMDIFRANEKINRRKRLWLMSRVGELECIKERNFAADLTQAVRRVVLALAEREQVVIYQRPLPVQVPDADDEDKTPVQYVLDEVKRLQATGVIDIEAEIRVGFVGDKRVLNDLKLLAESGYGEDNFGNNTPLPDEISYLRR